MTQATTHQGPPEHSGPIWVPAAPSVAHVEPHTTLERTIGNPLVKLLASLLFAAVTAYTALMVSTINGRLSAQDSLNAKQTAEIQDLQIWRAAHTSEALADRQSRAEQLRAYESALSEYRAQNAQAVQLLREFLERMPRKR